MKNREEIEAIALEKYPRIENPKNNHLKLVDSVRAKERQAFREAYEQAQNESQPLLTAKQAESICMGFYKDLVIHLESGLSTELFHGELVFNKHLEKETK